MVCVRDLILFHMENLTNLFGKILHLEDEHKPHVLKENYLSGVADFIKDCNVFNVIVMTGAGLSTAAGIPDFRSPKSGLYDNLAEYNLPYPEAVFDVSYFYKNPEPFFKLAKSLWPRNLKPTLAHYFIKLLNDKYILLRNYTQNIDTLELLAGLPADKIVEAHGSFRTGKCTKCGKSYSYDWLKEKITGPSSSITGPKTYINNNIHEVKKIVNNNNTTEDINYKNDDNDSINDKDNDPNDSNSNNNENKKNDINNDINHNNNINHKKDFKNVAIDLSGNTNNPLNPHDNEQKLDLNNVDNLSTLATETTPPKPVFEPELGVMTFEKDSDKSATIILGEQSNKESLNEKIKVEVANAGRRFPPNIADTSSKCRKSQRLSDKKTILSTKGPACFIPRCEVEKCRGIVKPGIVFFGESLPSRFFSLIRSDFAKCDLLIVMGTSLVVQPFASLIDMVPEHTPRLLINKERPPHSSMFARLFGMPKGMDLDPGHKLSRDVFYKGTCDDGCSQLVQLLGWEDDLKKCCEQPILPLL